MLIVGKEISILSINMCHYVVGLPSSHWLLKSLKHNHNVTIRTRQTPRAKLTQSTRTGRRSEVTAATGP